MMQIQQMHWGEACLLYCRHCDQVSALSRTVLKEYWVTCPNLKCGVRGKVRTRKLYDLGEEVGVPRMFLARVSSQAGRTLLKMLGDNSK